jgi:hypothetical protein
VPDVNGVLERRWRIYKIPGAAVLVNHIITRARLFIMVQAYVLSAALVVASVVTATAGPQTLSDDNWAVCISRLRSPLPCAC